MTYKIREHYVSEAPGSGDLKCLIVPKVIEKGRGSIHYGLDGRRKAVSARKIVFEFDRELCESPFMRQRQG